jgi:hypothetical protein
VRVNSPKEAPIHHWSPAIVGTTQVIVAPTLLGLFLNEKVRPVANAIKPFSGVFGLVFAACVLGGALAVHGAIIFSSLGAIMVPNQIESNQIKSNQVMDI